MTIVRLSSVEALEPLARVGETEGYRFVRRLLDQHATGENRFDQPGEALFACLYEGRLVGVCGLNRDPYCGRTEVGRLRHLYVHPAYRRAQVGQALVRAALAHAEEAFETVVLRTDSPSAASFYRALGFVESTIHGATHEIALS